MEPHRAQSMKAAVRTGRNQFHTRDTWAPFIRAANVTPRPRDDHPMEAGDSICLTTKWDVRPQASRADAYLGLQAVPAPCDQAHHRCAIALRRVCPRYLCVGVVVRLGDHLQADSHGCGFT